MNKNNIIDANKVIVGLVEFDELRKLKEETLKNKVVTITNSSYWNGTQVTNYYSIDETVNKLGVKIDELDKTILKLNQSNLNFKIKCEEDYKTKWKKMSLFTFLLKKWKNKL